MPPITLSAVLQPCSPEEFLASTWGKSFRHIAGEPGKFAPLLPWSRYNALLREHELAIPRLMRLILNHAEVPTTAYQRQKTTRGGMQVSRLDPVRLKELLRQGATLVLNAIDETVEPISQLAENLEKTFHEDVGVNAYFSCGTTQCFQPHWDLYDVFVLQVAGRKRWTLYGVTREWPLANEYSRYETPPTEPVWDHVLEAGDLLYVPRGWWHEAIPLAEPTLHLTVGIPSRTGMDFVTWLQEELASRPIFRQDLPRFATVAEQAEHMRRMRAEFLAAWDERALQRYFFQHDLAAVPRSRFSLPWSVSPTALPCTDEAFVQLTVSRSTTLPVALLSNEKLRPYASQAEELLCPLLDGQPHSIAEICARANGNMDRESMRTFLGELVLHGLAAVVAAE